MPRRAVFSPGLSHTGTFKTEGRQWHVPWQKLTVPHQTPQQHASKKKKVNAHSLMVLRLSGDVVDILVVTVNDSAGVRVSALEIFNMAVPT